MLHVGGGSRATSNESRCAGGKLKAARSLPVVPEADRKPQDFIGDVTLSPDGRLIYAASLYRDSVKVINPQSGRVIAEYKTGRRPYRILFHPHANTYFVPHSPDATLPPSDAATAP